MKQVNNVNHFLLSNSGGKVWEWKEKQKQAQLNFATNESRGKVYIILSFTFFIKFEKFQNNKK